MDDKERKEFEEFKKWKEENEKFKFEYRPSPLLKTKFGKILMWGLLAAIAITIIVLLARGGSC